MNHCAWSPFIAFLQGKKGGKLPRAVGFSVGQEREKNNNKKGKRKMLLFT
jgi:hypothetical protein